MSIKTSSQIPRLNDPVVALSPKKKNLGPLKTVRFGTLLLLLREVESDEFGKLSFHVKRNREPFGLCLECLGIHSRSRFSSSRNDAVQVFYRKQVLAWKLIDALVR